MDFAGIERERNVLQRLRGVEPLGDAANIQNRLAVGRSALAHRATRRRVHDPKGRSCTIVLSAPAGHVDDRAGHVGRRVAQQPDDRLGDFLGCPGPPERDGGADLIRPIGVAVGGVNFRLDHAGPDRIDAHAFAAEFLRQAERERVDRGLRAGIVDVECPAPPIRAATDEIRTIEPPLSAAGSCSCAARPRARRDRRRGH